MILEFAAQRPSVVMSLIDTAPRQRAIHQMSVVRRVLQGVPLMVSTARSLWRKLRADEVDVVHMNTAGQLALIRDLMVATLARRYGVPVIYHVRFGRAPDILARRTLEGRVMALVARRCHTLVALDPATEGALREHLPNVPVQRIPNCIDLATLPEPPSPGSNDTSTALFAGWVIPTKGMAELMEAWSATKAAAWRLLVAGPGDEAYIDELKAMVKNSGAVDFIGELNRTEVLRQMASCDVFVFPSHTEGFPNAVLEAMALGRPIVATDVGAIGSMLADGCGVVVPSRDAVALEKALFQVTTDLDLRQKMGIAARERVEQQYALPHVFAKYEALWREASGQRQLVAKKPA